MSRVLLVSFPCHRRTVSKISSQWEARAEEMSQTLLTNKKQNILPKYTSLTLSSQSSRVLTRINRPRYVNFCQNIGILSGDPVPLMVVSPTSVPLFCKWALSILHIFLWHISFIKGTLAQEIASNFYLRELYTIPFCGIYWLESLIFSLNIY